MSQQPLIALVDCNNFYVSCERVFRPDLWHKPVAVLSNNDGCIVARSQEVKDLGIKMATPVYQVQHLIKRHHIHLLSSNYAFYADMSSRVMQSLEGFCPELEIYSIDESFLDLTGLQPDDTINYALQIKKKVQRCTGIPVCIGIGPTKTLAKLANYAAKQWKKTGGVVDLSDPIRRTKLMRLVPVSKIWGIGRQTSKRLQNLGINSAYDLAQQPLEFIQHHFNIVLARTLMELNGIACLSLEQIASPKQQIVCSRSFKHRLTEYQQLAEAVTIFCSRATEKLRMQNSIAGSISVFIRTNPYNPNEPQYQRSILSKLERPTSDTRRIINTAHQLLKLIYKAGYRFHKCGVQLSHIQVALAEAQLDLFDLSASPDDNKSRQLMQTMDLINRRYPNGIAVSTAKIKPDWQYQVERLSKRYTSNWDELAMVKCQ